MDLKHKLRIKVTRVGRQALAELLGIETPPPTFLSTKVVVQARCIDQLDESDIQAELPNIISYIEKKLPDYIVCFASALGWSLERSTYFFEHYNDSCVIQLVPDVTRWLYRLPWRCYLREWKEKYCTTQRQLALKIGTSPDSVSHWLAGIY